MTTLTRYSVQCRATLDGDTLIGHAAVFGQLAKVPGGYEQLGPTAFDDVLKRADSDVTSLWNHDPQYLLGREAAGTLRVKVDGEGLAFENDLPDTSYANDLRILVARGDITGASFGFLPDLDKSTWTRAEDGSQIHTINALEFLRDVSPVTFPAYSGAGVALRSKVEFNFGQASARSQMVRARARVLLKERH